MKLKYPMTVMDIDDHYVAIPTDCDDDARCILRLNDTTAEILKLLENEITEEKIVAALQESYDAPAGVIESSVQKIIATLREKGLLSEE